MNSIKNDINSAEHKEIDLMEKIAAVMEQQSEALVVVAKAALTNSGAVVKVAESKHIQAMAVENIVNNIEYIGASLHDIRNAITNVDNTLKRYSSGGFM